MRVNTKILVIDDEEGVRKVVSSFFQKNGCRVSTAPDGHEGIEKAQQDQFDLIILDINMPRMSGMDALPILCALNPGARVVIMTGFGSYESKIEAREKGAYDYLLKPVDIAKIKEVADRALPDRRQFKTGTGLIRVRLTTGKVNPEVARVIPERVARVFNLIAIEKDADTLTVAMADPFDIVALDTLSAHTGCRIQPVLADRYEIVKAIEEAYKQSLDGDQTLSDRGTEPVAEPEPEQHEPPVSVEASEHEVGQLINQILLQAVQSQASEIHIEPWGHSISVRVRIDGIMHEITPPPKNWFLPMVSQVKGLAGLDIAEYRIPQERRARIKLENKEISLRIDTMPTVYGESIAIHLLEERSRFTGIEMLWFDDQNLKILLDAVQQPSGMVYVTGPAGSGKTTTLYAVLHHLNSRERKIMTIEDVVEYEIQGINQVTVRSDIGLTFASALRAILRQNPDIIMVGETRDLETAEIAIRAALTGHLVLSTLHTNDAPSSITRLIDLGIQPFLVSSAVNLIMAQRLVRRICPDCKFEARPSPELVERMKLVSAITIPETLFAGAGCANCNRTGYRGRLAIHELLPITSRVRSIIMNGGGEEQFREAAAAVGCGTLMESGLAKVAQGLTTLDEVLRVVAAKITA